MPGSYSAILWQTRAEPQGGKPFLQNRQLAQGLADQGGHEFLGHGGGNGTLGHKGAVPAVQQGGEAVCRVLVKAPMKVAASSFGV